MTEQEIKDLIKELERKEAVKEEMTVSELCILDVHNGLKKQGKEISERTIQFIKFMID